MNVIYYELPEYGDDVLMHYGRKGMKWYQHIFSAAETAGRAVTSGAKTVYKTGQKARNDRIEKAKNNAINTGDYEKIKKYERYMSDADLKKAQTRMESNAKLRTLQSEVGPSKRVQKKIDKAVRKGDFKNLMKLEKRMSDKDFKAAYDRLDTRRKIKDMNDQSALEKGIKVMETIGRVGTAVLTIKQVSAGLKKAKADKAESIKKQMEADEAVKILKSGQSKGYQSAMDNLAKEAALNVMKDDSEGSIKERTRKANKIYNDFKTTQYKGVSERKERKAEAKAKEESRQKSLAETKASLERQRLEENLREARAAAEEKLRKKR